MRLKLKVGLIFLVALVVRVAGLDRLPIELFGDELDAGYQAYSVLKTGEDYLGHPFPINFHSFSETRQPMFIYSLVPSVAIFGLNELGVRAAPAVWGTLSILIFFMVLYRLTDERTALLGASFLALTPWHWHYSRAGFEVTLLLLFILLGVLFWVNQGAKRWFLPASVLFMILALFTYSSAAGFVPFLAALLFLVFRPKGISRGVKGAVLLTVVVGVIFFAAAGFGQPGERLGSVSLLSYDSLSDEISFKRKFDANKITGEIFHNKPVLILREMTANYFKSFSPQFLALDGDPNPTHSEIGGGFGELFHIEYLLAVLGVGVLVARRRERTSQFFLGWLIISPISSSVTIGGGEHATRLFLMLPGLVAAAAVGFWALAGSLKGGWQRKTAVALIFGGLAIEVIFFVHHVTSHYRVESWRAWQYGYREAMKSLPPLGKQTVVISDKGEPALIRYLFWAKADPAWFQTNFTGDKLKKNLLPGFDGFRVGPNILIGNISDGVPLEKFLKSGMTFVGIQGKDIPGDMELDKRPAGGLRMISIVRDPEFSRPLIQVFEKRL